MERIIKKQERALSRCRQRYIDTNELRYIRRLMVLLSLSEHFNSNGRGAL